MRTLPKYSVLCFGDSNTWGFVPGTGDRYDANTRWPGVLQQQLGPEFNVIEEGFNGRTTIWEDPTVPGRNGRQYLIPCLGSHRPLDLVVLSLGINDLKAQFGASAEDIANGAATLIGLIAQSASGVAGGIPKILVISPPRIGKLTQYASQFDGRQEQSARLGVCMRAVARQTSCEFIDAAEFVVTSESDGIHLEPDEHQKLGEAVAQRVRQMLS